MMTLYKRREANKDFQNRKITRVIAFILVIFSISIFIQQFDSNRNHRTSTLLDVTLVAENKKIDFIESNVIRKVKSSTILRSDFVKVQSTRAALRGTPSLAKSYAKSKINSNKHYKCLVELWTRESNWNVSSKNSSSGAYGIPQALPGNKMASEGKDWKNSYKTQVSWGLKYIKSRYGNACGALAHHDKYNWY